MKALFALLLALPLLAACNTIAGVGKDVEAAGKVVKDTAEDVQEDLQD
ncbi:MAG: entericidin A/B family lipoprotein [Pseudomonadota bacterium]